MREILFRGKRIDNKEWVYGSFVNHTSSESMIIDEPYQTNSNELFAIVFWPVDPKTVGQYVDLVDEHGVKLFEGDIIKTKDDMDPIYVIKWGGGWNYPAFDTSPYIDCDCNGLSYLVNSGCDFEIIGNIYDNPELLEGDK